VATAGEGENLPPGSLIEDFEVPPNLVFVTIDKKPASWLHQPVSTLSRKFFSLVLNLPAIALFRIISGFWTITPKRKPAKK